MPTLECSGAVSNLILQAARTAIPAHVERRADAGERNAPLIPLLEGLLDALQSVAGAVADNAFDTAQPLPKGLAADLAAQARKIATDLDQAGRDHHTSDWSLPSMTGKELV
jgi:hypothetical protein